MEYWLAQPVFDNGGVLTVGYTYPNLLMSESYNAPGSPYWSFKTFVCLALPDSHPFWKAESEPLPKLSEVLAVKECDMVLCLSLIHISSDEKTDCGGMVFPFQTFKD